jgi:hypothetical protein
MSAHPRGRVIMNNHATTGAAAAGYGPLAILDDDPAVMEDDLHGDGRTA